MLEDYFYYDDTSTSCLRWKQTRYTGKPKRVLVNKDDMAGSTVKDAYYETSLDGKGYMVHRIIWELHNGEIPKELIIDHIDGNGLNNNISNLRVVDHKTNSRNSKMRSHNTSGFTGVAKTRKDVGNKTYWYYTALWKTLDGAQKTANYSIEKLGDSVAFLLAFSHRQYEMEQLDLNGAGYTSRHGRKDSDENNSNP